MAWVLLFVGIALAGLATMACLAVRLWRKAVALMDEVGGATERAGELIDLLARVEVADPDHHARDVAVDEACPAR